MKKVKVKMCVNCIGSIDDRNCDSCVDYNNHKFKQWIKKKKLKPPEIIIIKFKKF